MDQGPSYFAMSGMAPSVDFLVHFFVCFDVLLVIAKSTKDPSLVLLVTILYDPVSGNHTYRHPLSHAIGNMIRPFSQIFLELKFTNTLDIKPGD